MTGQALNNYHFQNNLCYKKITSDLIKAKAFISDVTLFLLIEDNICQLLFNSHSKDQEQCNLYLNRMQCEFSKSIHLLSY